MPYRAILALTMIACLGCQTEDKTAARTSPDAAMLAPAATNTPVAPATPPEPEEPEAFIREGDLLRVPRHELLAGSRPGLVGRNPQREAALVSTPLGDFDIDAHPASLGGARVTARSQREAASTCGARGRRLCTELEWEQACKLGGDAFVSEGLEWTQSAGGPSFGDAPTIVVRGGSDNAATQCAARRALNAEASPRGVGVRCCGGEMNDATYPAPRRGRPFRALEVSDVRAREVLATVPELARYASDFHLFRAADADRALRRCAGTPADLHGWELVDGVIEWSPGWGPANWVFAGRSGDDALVVVLHRVGESFVHGSSFINAGEPRAVAISFTPPSRDTLRFSASVDCPVEGGVIAAEPDGRVMTYHRRVGW